MTWRADACGNVTPPQHTTAPTETPRTLPVPLSVPAPGALITHKFLYAPSAAPRIERHAKCLLTAQQRGSVCVSRGRGKAGETGETGGGLRQIDPGENMAR